jgi:uncharacterized 2Fe-2S/4Fe-4S cluster protein (DUF4445 family)
MREGEFETTITLAYRPASVMGEESAKIRLTDIQPGDHTAMNYGLAVDIGTTTVFVQLLDLNTGQVLDTPWAISTTSSVTARTSSAA